MEPGIVETQMVGVAGHAEGLHWYCIRSRPKSEHIAAQHLREHGFEVFLPRIRFRRSTRQGMAWVTEALFPNYLFSRFDRAESFRQVRSTNGVSTIVHFGHTWPVLPDSTIEELRERFGADSLHVLENTFQPGDEVKVAEGPFQGLLAVVRQVLLGPERVRILLEFLGRQTSIDLPMHSVLPTHDVRADALEQNFETEN